MRILSGITIFIGMLCTTQAKAQFQSFFPLDQMSTLNIVQIQSAYDAFAAKVPPSWKASLPKKIGLMSLSKSEHGTLDPLCAGSGGLRFGHSNSVLGYMTYINTPAFKGPVIYLHEDLLKGHAVGACRTGQIAQLRGRTLLHEMSHIYDFDPVEPRELSLHKSELGSSCNPAFLTQPYTCFRKNQISDDLQFIYLAGFRPLIKEQNNPNGNSEIKMDKLHFQRINIFMERSPRSYEYSSPQEFFAVNMEYFIFDPEYKCRRPALFDYLKTHFNFDPSSTETSCPAGNSNVLAQGRILNLDASRIYAIHYMKTAPGPQIQAWWGHALLRIIICSPERQSLTADCINDTKYHIVVDFAAQLFDQSLSLYGGLAGHYPSGINFKGFNEFRKDSLILSQRDVTSYPLQLNRHEIEMTVKVLTERYWSQLTQYFFFRNNCATQVLISILASVSRIEIDKNKVTYQMLKPDFVLTPQKVVDYLAAVGLIQKQSGSPIEGQTYFTSPQRSLTQKEKKYEQLLSAKLGEILTQSAEQRLEFYRKIFEYDLTAEQKQDMKQAFIEIEQVKSAQINNAVLEFWSKPYQTLIGSKVLSQRSKLSSLSSQNSSWDGYGVPMNIAEIYPDIAKQASEDRKQRLESLAQSLNQEQKTQLNILHEQQELLMKNAKYLILKD